MVSTIRGNDSFDSATGQVTTATVLSATAGATVGAVGTYAMLSKPDGNSISLGETYSGSGLRWTTVASANDWNYSTSNSVYGTVGYGTWMALSASGSTAGTSFTQNTLWLRIA